MLALVTENYTLAKEIFKELLEIEEVGTPNYAMITHSYSRLCHHQKKYDEAFAEVERLKADPSIDQHKFVKLLAFYVRVSPEYTDKELPYEILVNKVRGLRYVAYNMYDRDDAMPHFYYVQGLEYLLKRALEEGKSLLIWSQLRNTGKRCMICVTRI